MKKKEIKKDEEVMKKIPKSKIKKENYTEEV